MTRFTHAFRTACLPSPAWFVAPSCRCGCIFSLASCVACDDACASPFSSGPISTEHPMYYCNRHHHRKRGLWSSQSSRQLRPQTYQSASEVQPQLAHRGTNRRPQAAPRKV
eukprot:3165724-Amphidinium_carterae.2